MDQNVVNQNPWLPDSEMEDEREKERETYLALLLKMSPCAARKGKCMENTWGQEEMNKTKDMWLSAVTASLEGSGAEF